MKKAVFQTQEKEVVCCKNIIKYSIIGLLSTLYRTAERGCATSVSYTHLVLMNLLHAPMWFFTIARMAREEDTRTAAEKYGYISEMVKRINRRGRVTAVSYTHLDVYKRQIPDACTV